MTLVEARPAVHVGPFLTVPNGITVVRTVAAVTAGLAALVAGSMTLLVVAYGIYWLGDMLDGLAARRLGQETRAGAVLDIVSDRACTAVLCVGLIALVPGVAVVASVFLPSFMVLDTMLSLAFLCWPVISPNDFHVVDRRVWVLNWSPVAKAVNTAGVVGAVALGQYRVALAVAIAVLVVKLWSAVRVAGLLRRDGRA
ncbi:CDP-alcohol phosphatidyltransferase family protein [Dactylosporangium sp. NPDC005572]|uniref:CDP-alcohol phosphatidyltransferase family protein n=1 Tax=Dactylosporangium sp. NPDC005572 TaxID=3156889 RepID=UPI0033B04627